MDVYELTTKELFAEARQALDRLEHLHIAHRSYLGLVIHLREITDVLERCHRQAADPYNKKPTPSCPGVGQLSLH
jgi:hypothetical protein